MPGYMKAFPLVLIALVLSACASSATLVRANMIGLWEQNGPTVSAITLRRADGTYRAKKIQEHDVSRPPITYEFSGRWSIKGKRYEFSLHSVSTPIWKKDLGKKWSLEVLESTWDLLTYYSSDGAIVEERRIGEASDAEFERTALKPLVKGQ
jgi:hypothetical protein